MPTTTWGLPRSAGPAGLISARVADVLAFVQMHLSGGLAADGRRVLSQASVEAMTAKQAELPDPRTLGDSWGLGWIRYGWGGERLVGHDGTTLGQAAFLRVLPSQGLAVSLLTNGGHALDLSRELLREVFDELAGVQMPAPVEPATSPVDVEPAAYVGRYERTGLHDRGLRRRRGTRPPLDRHRRLRGARAGARPRVRARTRRAGRLRDQGSGDDELDRRHVLRARRRGPLRPLRGACESARDVGAGVWLKPDTGRCQRHGNESVAAASADAQGCAHRRRRGIEPRDSASAESRWRTRKLRGRPLPIGRPREARAAPRGAARLCRSTSPSG